MAQREVRLEPLDRHSDEDADDANLLLRDRENSPRAVPYTTASGGRCGCRPPRLRIWALFVVLAVAVMALSIGFLAVPGNYAGVLFTRQTFAAGINATRARENLRVLTSYTHMAGTPGSKQQADVLVSTFRALGISNTRLETFDVLLSTPLNRSVQSYVGGQLAFTASLVEPPLAADPTSSDPGVVPTFNAYSASGVANGTLVYVNFGRKEDFDALVALGVDLSGKVGIARYGKVFRGVKAYLAQQHGMSGLLIYSDPAEEGAVRGAVWPSGPWRPAAGVQRGSVQFLSVQPGDPSTPGYPSTAFAQRLSYGEIKGVYVPSIVVQPLSWADAEPLLRALGNISTSAVPGGDWQGGGNFTYFVGPGPNSVAVTVYQNYTMRTIYNVIAEITGQNAGAQSVVIGAHRDAWVFGATDPTSATAVLIEVANGFANLLRAGWTPRRTIVLCSWDAEEYALIGSTEHTELHAASLFERAVAYLNVDTAVSGRNFSAKASPELVDVLINVTKVVRGVNDNGALLFTDTVYDQWRAQTPALATPPIDYLGSGSDYSGFVQHLGISALDVRFAGPNSGGDAQYHSVYDSFAWMGRFGDPTFERFGTLAKVWGLTGLELADRHIVPLNMTRYNDVLSSAVAALVASAAAKGLNDTFLAPVRSAATEFASAALANSDAINRLLAYERLSVERPDLEYDAVNTNILMSLRALLLADGLPGRPWFRNALFAPGFYLGYGAVVLPGVSEAVQRGDVVAMSVEAARVGAVVRCSATVLRGGDRSCVFRPQV